MPLSREDIDQYVLEVGRFTVGYATLEWGLNAWVAIIFSFYPYEGMASNRPIALSRRVEFVRKAYRTHRTLMDHTSKAIALLNGIDGVKKERAFLMKGIVSIQKSDAQRFLMQGINFKPTGSAVSTLEISLERLMEVRKQVFAIGNAIIEHGKDIHPG